MKDIFNKIMSLLTEFIHGAAQLSWLALAACLVIGGALIMLGNEFGGKKFCRNGIYGFIIIKIVEMML